MDVSLLIRLIDQVTGPAGKVRAALKGIGDGVNQFRGGFADAIRNGFSVENLETATRNAEQRLQAARGRLLGAVGLAMTLAAPTRLAAQFDQSMKGLEKVLDDLPVDRLEKLRRFALNTSAIVPVAAREMVELMAEAAQGGVPIDDLEAFARYVANAAVAFDMAGGEIGERFAKLRNVYRLNQVGIEDLGDATNHLSNAMASKASEITDFANRAAGAAAIFKLSAIETSAVGSALISAGIVPETAARGFTAMATRILSGGKDIDAAFKSIGMTRKGFLKELEKDGPAALQKLFETMATDKDGMQAMIDIVGRDFADDFAKLLGNPELLAEAFRLVEERAAYAGSATAEAGKMASGAAKQWELLVNKFTRLGIVVGERVLPVLLKVADSLGGVVDKVVAFADAHPQLASGLVQAVAGLVALSVAARVLGFVFAGLRLGLIRIASLFLRFSNGRNIAVGWRILSGAARMLTGSLKLLGAAAGLITVGLIRLAGVKPSWALVSWLAKLGGAAAGIVGLKNALRGLPAATGAAAKAGPGATGKGGMSLGKMFTTALGAFGVIEKFLNLPDEIAAGAARVDEKIAAGKSRAEAMAEVSKEQQEEAGGLEQWLEKNVGSPRTWLGLDRPTKPVDPQRAIDAENYRREFQGVPFEGGMHRVGRGAAPAPGQAGDISAAAAAADLERGGRAVAQGGEQAGGALQDGAAALAGVVSALNGVAGRLSSIRINVSGVGGAIRDAKAGALHEGTD